MTNMMIVWTAEICFSHCKILDQAKVSVVFSFEHFQLQTYLSKESVAL